MAKLTFKKAAEIIDRIIDEDYHVYTKDALEALEMGMSALLEKAEKEDTKEDGQNHN